MMPAIAVATDIHTCATYVVVCEASDRCTNPLPADSSIFRAPVTQDDIHAVVARMIDTCLRANIGGPQ